MAKRISVILLVIVLLICAFSSCKPDAPVGEEATIISDTDADNIRKDYDFLSEQATVADGSKAVLSAEKLNELINNPDLSVVSYDGTEDITIKNDAHIEKSVIIKTIGSFTLLSTVKTLIAERIGGEFTLKAKADNVILRGEELHVSVEADTGNVYIEGKNAVLDIRAATEKILANNVTAVINNYSENTVTVTLANGTKTEIAPQKSYDVHENLIYDLR